MRAYQAKTSPCSDPVLFLLKSFHYWPGCWSGCERGGEPVGPLDIFMLSLLRWSGPPAQANITASKPTDRTQQNINPVTVTYTDTPATEGLIASVNLIKKLFNYKQLSLHDTKNNGGIWNFCHPHFL